ncbi:putative maf-like protein [Cocos nucifera]|uniref:Putative maf-like protein n=1 Tax=Cocos nucifera TaxID=13894 RepID=A0A8K0I7G5_COCNU|nr:putative maf-like protein [Cocos nucifera]
MDLLLLLNRGLSGDTCRSDEGDKDLRRVPHRAAERGGTSDELSNSGVPFSCPIMWQHEYVIFSCAVPRSSVTDRLLSADIDEKEIRREKPEELVMALAEAKADAIITKLRSNGFKEDHAEPTLLITADQVVVHGGIIREKPSGAQQAREFIKGYSGGHASTVGSVLVTNLKTGARKGGLDKAEVYYHKIPEEVIESLIKEGDVLYVAGGLMVENPLTSPFVEAIVGTIDSIMGLPKALTEKLIREALE